MDNNAARDLLRHAMAYRERAMAATLDRDDRLATGVLVEAESLLARVRTALMADLETRATELRAAIENPAAGLDVSLLRRDISVFNEILRAKRADQLGEFIDLPLEAYPSRIHTITEGSGLWAAQRASRERRRYTIAGMEVAPTRRGFVVWLICLIAAWVASAYYLGVLWPFRELALTASPPDHGIVYVACRNARMSAVTLFVPGTPGALLAESSTDYALVLYVREKPGDAYRLLPAIPSAWTVQGEELHETTPVELGPLLSCELALSIAGIREAIGVSFTHLRLVLARAGGATATACEIEMPVVQGK